MRSLPPCKKKSATPPAATTYGTTRSLQRAPGSFRARASQNSRVRVFNISHEEHGTHHRSASDCQCWHIERCTVIDLGCLPDGLASHGFVDRAARVRSNGEGQVELLLLEPPGGSPGELTDVWRRSYRAAPAAKSATGSPSCCQPDTWLTTRVSSLPVSTPMSPNVACPHSSNPPKSSRNLEPG